MPAAVLRELGGEGLGLLQLAGDLISMFIIIIIIIIITITIIITIKLLIILIILILMKLILIIIIIMLIGDLQYGTIVASLTDEIGTPDLN